MGAEIDRLELKVEAQATKANNQLDKLVGKLDSLSNSLSHINSSGLAGLSNGVAKFAQASSQLSNVKTADFTRLTKNIQSLSSLNTQQIYGAASAMRTLSTAINSIGGVSASSMQVAQVAKDISKLGGANVQKAIVNLPALATALKNLMTTLSKAPSVSNNIIQMTNALANLSSQGNRVGSSSNSIVNGLNRTGSAMASTKKQTLSLAAAFGKFYASWFLVIRGVNKLWGSIENSMNYVEVLNYFDAAFGQVADSAVSQWENAGYDSADAYYESFSSRAKELTTKMTGFNVNDDGALTATGNASLGINPTKLMNYQATFAQMSSSIGVASETSLLLSQALTEIGADLASVKNMDFDKVWKDMASGLAGMSRTLDKYGVNIRNVNLQQKLFDLGIEENITNLNQNDKALLRAIILLDSTKYAWGDLADTLNQPANQMRLLDSNLNNLSRTIGNLFLPVVSKVLPYVNGLVIALQRLFTWVGSLLGIDISGITQAVGDSAFDIGELVGETDDLAGSLGDATKAADKLKRGIRGFDELNVISTQTDTSSTLSGTGLPSGLLDNAFAKSFSEYQKAWDKAFLNMENRANEFAGKVEKFLQPVRDIIQDFAIGDYFQAGQDTSNLVAGIFNFFADAIDKVDWYAIGENIGDYLSGVNWIKVLGSVGHFVWEAFKASLELWSGALSTSPIETALISMLAMPKALKLLASSSLITKLSKLANNIGNITGAFVGNNESIILLKNNYPKLGKAVDVLGDSFQRFMFGVHYGDIKGGINAALTNIRNNLTGLQKGAITAIAGFAEFSILSNTFEDLVTGSENLVTGIVKIGGTAGVAALAMYTALGPAGLAIAGVTGLTGAIKGIYDALVKTKEEMEQQRQIEMYGEQLSVLTEKINSVTSAIENQINTSKEYVEDAGIAETKMAEDLADRYFDLAEKENLSNEEKQEMQALAKTLVDTLPSLETYYNTQTGLLDTTRQSVEELINTRLQEIRLSAIEDELKNTYKSQIDAAKSLNDALEVTNKSKERMIELEKEHEKYKDKADLLNQYIELQDKMASSSENAGALIDKSNKLWNEITNNGEDPNLANYDYLNYKIKESSAEINDFAGEYKQTIENLQKTVDVYELTQDTIDEYTNMLTIGMTEAANNSVSGYANGLENNKQASEASYNLARDILSEFARGQDSHSPSKEFAKLGKDSVDGYNLGITNSEKSTFSTIAIYVKSILKAFSSLPNTLYGMGIQSMNGLLNGMSSMESDIYDKADSIADKIAKTIKTALEIQSPSRVMFSLGEFTMQGFQLGMENLYGNIQKSIEKFGGTLQYEIATSPQTAYTGAYSSSSFPVPEYNNYSYYENQNNYDSSETNSLLRKQNDLLLAILQKPNLGNDDVFNAARAVYKNEAIRRYGNSSAYDPIWG